MCLCKENHWCRTWEETRGGKYPYSEHAPGCDEYKLEEFVIIDQDGTKCIMEPSEATAFSVEASSDFSATGIMLTRDQFERIPEFQGF